MCASFVLPCSPCTCPSYLTLQVCLLYVTEMLLFIQQYQYWFPPTIPQVCLPNVSEMQLTIIQFQCRLPSNICLLLLFPNGCQLLWWISCGVQSAVKLNMDKCQICSQFIFPHARKEQCFICNSFHHMKCLDPEYLNYIESIFLVLLWLYHRDISIRLYWK